MFNTARIEPYIAQPTTTPFRWGWDFSHWVPWMSHYPLRPPRKTHPMLKLKLKKELSSLNGSGTSTNRFMIFYRNPMPSTSNAMINIACHTSFRWETKFGFTCRMNALEAPIGSYVHFSIDLTSFPRLWDTILLSSIFPRSLACTQCSMWISFDHIFHHYWTPQR
jgi:hypothetical protein